MDLRGHSCVFSNQSSKADRMKGELEGVTKQEVRDEATRKSLSSARCVNSARRVGTGVLGAQAPNSTQLNDNHQGRMTKLSEAEKKLLTKELESNDFKQLVEGVQNLGIGFYIHSACPFWRCPSALQGQNPCVALLPSCISLDMGNHFQTFK